jgi:hypothetical protein
MSNKLGNWLGQKLKSLIEYSLDRRLGDHPANYYRFHRYCPQCGTEMSPDVILEDGRGLRAANIQYPDIYNMEATGGIMREANGDPVTVHVKGEGSYCSSCKRGWTIGELYEMGMEKRGKSDKSSPL